MPALLEQSTAPPGAFGTGNCVASPLPPPAGTHPPLLARLLRAACAFRAFTPPTPLHSPPTPHPPVPFFRSLFGVIPPISHGGSAGESLTGRTGRCAAASPGADLPAEPAASSRPRKLYPAPRLGFYPKRLQMAKVPGAKRPSDWRLHERRAGGTVYVPTRAWRGPRTNT